MRSGNMRSGNAGKSGAKPPGSGNVRVRRSIQEVVALCRPFLNRSVTSGT